jgi:hypothetical protein
MWRSSVAGGLVLALLVLMASASAAMALQVSAPTRGGGIDGGLPDTTNGADAVAPPVDSVPSTTPTAGTTDTTATTDTTPTTATTAPAVTAPSAAAPAVTTPPAPAAADPAVAAAVTSVPNLPAPTLAGKPADGAVAGDDGQGAGALRPASTSHSSGVVRSPVMLVIGLGMVIGGAAVLVVRSRRSSGGTYA